MNLMRETAEWIDHRVRDGVAERPFRVRLAERDVPGVLWLPADTGAPPPVVLLGHGGSTSKTSRSNIDLAHWFAGQAGFAAVAIDGPYHGDRALPAHDDDWHRKMVDEGVDVVLDRMTRDWQSALDLLAAEGLADTTRMAYIGMSMGTRFGIPVVAAAGSRMRCAVLGKFGLRQAPPAPPELEVPERVVREAAQIGVPVLFHVPWDDEVFPRDSQFPVFDAFASPEKELIAVTGRHSADRQSAVARWREFVVRHVGSNNSVGQP